VAVNIHPFRGLKDVISRKKKDNIERKYHLGLLECRTGLPRGPEELHEHPQLVNTVVDSLLVGEIGEKFDVFECRKWRFPELCRRVV
jgi:hypothetical protein